MLDKILERLGGEKAVAERLGCGIPAICNWKVRGIPKGRWVDLVRLASEQKADLTLADVEEAHRAIKEAQGAT